MEGEDDALSNVVIEWDHRVNQARLESISNPEFERVIKQYIHWATAWDGALPADVFFGVWADWQNEKKALPLKPRTTECELAQPVSVAWNRQSNQALIYHEEIWQVHVDAL